MGSEESGMRKQTYLWELCPQMLAQHSLFPGGKQIKNENGLLHLEMAP
jgi:hypothetical protein